MQKFVSSLLPVLVLFFVFVAGMAAIQFSTPNMPDNDGFYHIKLASIMSSDGLKPEFRWLPLTILNEREYYDHHFLYHVALIPFTFFGDLRLGAKWSAVIFASFAFMTVWFLFRRQRISYSWLWALALLGISDAFLYRMSVTRAQSLSLAILVLACAWLLEGKSRHLLYLSFMYVWMYDAFPLILAMAVLHFLAVLMIEQRVDYKPLLYVTAGITLGVLINPYFPENIVFSFRHMLPKIAEATSIRVGNEWFPYDTQQILDNSLPALLIFVSGIIALGLSEKKMDVRTAFALLASLLFGLMFLQARRFVEYFPPFALIFGVFAWAPLFMDTEPASTPLSLSTRQRSFASLPILILSAAVAAGIARTIPRAIDAVENAKPYDLYADASRWLETNSPLQSRVFQTDWDDFPRLFYYNTHNTYLIGLDPTYMQLYDPNLYALWVLIANGEVDSPALIISNKFKAEYVLTDLNHAGFIRAAKADPGLKEVYRDDQALIYRIISP